MPEPDEWLMQQVTKGSSQHLDPLVRRYAAPILTFTSRLLGSTHRGEEAFQETFLAVWSRRQTYKYPLYFRPWLFRIAYNKCRELARHRNFLAMRYDTEPDPDHLDPSRTFSSFPSPADVAIATETSTLVESALSRLPDQQRAIVVMKIWNGMSYTEIAEALGSHDATVRSNMHYALANIRRYLEPRLRQP